MSELVLPVRATGQSSQRFSQARSTSSRFALLAGICAALLLAFPHRAQAAAYTPPIEFFHGTSVIAVGEAASAMLRPATEELFNGAQILITWTGSGETTSLDTTYYLYYYAFANFTGVTPGIFDVFATADWSARAENFGLPASSCISTASAPQSITVVTVTNVTASAYHVAEGSGPVTLTAQMTPINAPEKVFWDFAPSEGGGGFSTNQGLTTLLYHGAGWSSNRVVARCGTTSTEVLIHIYRVTGITASPQPAVAGEPITLTAITEPANCPLPITWNISTNTGATITNAFGPGTHTVIASLGAGTITQTLDVVSVGVKEILYEWPANSDNWLPWAGLATGFPPLPTTAAVAVGSSFRVKALPEPEGAGFPAGWPVWSGLASGSGPIATATFASVSTNLSDYQSVTATSGTSSRTEQAVVFGIDSILVATNHVAIGTNTLTLTPQMTPSSGGEHLVVWDCTNATLTLGSGASVEFPTDQAGSFTATATCGSSAASTNLFVYRVTEVTASPNPAAVGTPVVLNAITEPPSCPLPITWSVSTNISTTMTNFSASAGYHTSWALLGTSSNSCVVTNVGISHIEYQDFDLADAWLPPQSPLYTVTGISVPFRAFPDPADAAWPASQPVWFVDGVVQGSSTTFTLPGGPVASSVTNVTKVEVRCGSSQKDANVLFFKSELVSGPAIYWVGRNMSEWGVGERISITNRISPGDINPSALDLSWGTNFPGPVNFDQSTPVATLDDVTIVGGYEIIAYRGKNYYGNSVPIELGRKMESFSAPTSVTYVPVLPGLDPTSSIISIGSTNVSGSGVWHDVNTVSAGIKLALFVSPTDKDFSKLRFSEGIAPYEATGVLVPRYGGQTHQRGDEVQTIHRHTFGWLLSGIDTARTLAPHLGVGVTPAAGGYPTGGSATISIPFQWRMPSAPNGFNLWYFTISEIPHPRLVTPSGDTSGKKQNVSYSAAFGAPSSSYPDTTNPLLP